MEERCPPKQPSDGQQLPGGQMTPTTPIDDIRMEGSFEELTSSSEYFQESSSLQSKPEPPSIPESTRKITAYDDLDQEKGRSFSRGEKSISVVGSPNFMYLNSAYSSSVEVLPALYATVDLSKKTKNKKAAERASDTALIHTRRRSKSSESILSASPTFTHFAAFAADADYKSFEDALIPMIPAQMPHTERVSLALKSSVEPSDVEERAECVTNLPPLPAKKGSYSGQVKALERTLSEVSHISQKEK